MTDQKKHRAILNKLISRLRTDEHQLLLDIRSLFHGKLEWAVVGILVLLGFAVRFILLFRPMDIDESYTFLSYASQSFYTILSDYSFPNNHVFHSILVRLSYLILGDAPWAIRLPAFLAGLLMIPASYILGRHLFNRWVGWISAGLIAFWPELIQYSTNARGYTLVALISLIILSLAVYLKTHPNLAGWMALVILSALGFLTIPIMLYPCGAVFGWLFFSWILDDFGVAYHRRQFLRYLIFAGLGVVLLSLLFYLSIIFHYGLESLIGNRYVIGYSWETFIANLPTWLNRFSDTWFNVFPIITFFVLAGILLTLRNPNRQFRQYSSTLWVTILWLIIVICFQRVEILPRVFFPFLPFILIFSSAGWLGLIIRICGSRQNWILSASTGLFLVLLVVQASQLAGSNWGYFIGEKGETERAVLYVKNNLRADDIVVTNAADAWYYLNKEGISKEQTNNLQHKSYRRAWVLVDIPYGDTLESVATSFGPIDMPIDSRQNNLIIKYARLSIFLTLPQLQ